MTDDQTTPLAPAEQRHEASRIAYKNRDLTAYMSPFSPDVKYLRADGQSIDHAQLSRNVASQFRRLSAADWVSFVEASEARDDEVIETVSQSGWIMSTAFGFVHRIWRLDRRGLYTWRLGPGGWQITEVAVLSETVTSNGIRFGKRRSLPPLPALSGKDVVQDPGHG